MQKKKREIFYKSRNNNRRDKEWRGDKEKMKNEDYEVKVAGGKFQSLTNHSFVQKLK